MAALCIAGEVSANEIRNKTIMKIIQTLTLASAVAFMAGCNRSADTASTSSETTNSVNTVASTDATLTNGVTPTSRSLDSATRVYSDTNSASPKLPDNSGINVRDRATDALTASSQGGSAVDRELTRQIRRAITSNDQLSTLAKNIKIITQDGRITLRGPVKDDNEKKIISDLVAGLATSDKVDNQLEVKGATSPASTSDTTTPPAPTSTGTTNQ
jgi:hyperosmotically inducible protein